MVVIFDFFVIDPSVQSAYLIVFKVVTMQEVSQNCVFAQKCMFSLSASDVREHIRGGAWEGSPYISPNPSAFPHFSPDR